MKYYNSQQIRLQYYKLNHLEQLEVLYNALDYMQEYNGRTKFTCIAMAMGYDNYDGNDDSYYKRDEVKPMKSR